MSHEILFGSGEGADVGRDMLHPHYMNLLRALNGRGISYVLIGALAAAFAGSLRLTRDVDAICRDVRNVVGALYELGFRVVSHPVRSEPGAYAVFSTPKAALDALKHSGKPSFKSIHLESRREFDVWIASPDAARLSLEEVEAHAVNIDLSGIPVRRACAEHLIALKKIALSDDPSRQATDGADIAFLESYLRSHGPEIS